MKFIGETIAFCVVLSLLTMCHNASASEPAAKALKFQLRTYCSCVEYKHHDMGYRCKCEALRIK